MSVLAWLFGRQTPPRRMRRALRLEPLEPRVLLSGSPLISEFMALNDNVVADEDGHYSDWIEIHNAGDEELSLAGWYLADDADSWQFPEVTLDAGDFLLVFASGKDRAVAGAELHTNFELDGDGDYLALLGPDGSSVIHEFAPQFPKQVEDVSYGLPDATTVWEALVSPGDALSYHVPGPGDDVLEWTAAGFDDDAWVDSIAIEHAGLVLTEMGTGDTRFVEIQNISEQALDTAGWSVLLNDASRGIDAVNAVAWDLPASVAVGELLYRTDDPGDQPWGGPIDWDAEGSGWATIVDEAGSVVDFAAWGYNGTEIASLEIDHEPFTGITIGDRWRGAGAAVGTTGPGPSEGFVAFNDHIPAAGTHVNATSYAANGAAAGLLKDIATGANTAATLTTSHSGVLFQGASAPPAAGTDAHAIFVGFIDFSAGDGASLEVDNADHYTHAFSGLDTGNDITYHFAGTAVRGRNTYTNRWTLVTLAGAESATGAHSEGVGVVVVSPTQVALWTGHNSAAGQGFVAKWTDIDPGPDGRFSIISSQYRGPTPGVGSGTADGTKGYGLSAIRLEEAVPTGPLAWLSRAGDTDTDTAGDFTRVRSSSRGAQNPELTVPFLSSIPATTGIGFSSGQPDFESDIHTDVAAAMQGANASLWTRVEFSVADLSEFDVLTLRMKYDDGFVAYLNGEEVARRNAPETLAYDSAATDEHPDAEAVVFEDIDISDYLTSLQVGSNVLAIHGLNLGAGDGDLLFVPELIATSVLDAPQYMTTPTPGEPNVPGALGLVADTRFSVDRGFYTEPFDVEITTDTALAEIRYTLDGTRPTATHGAVYDGPIDVDGQAVLRAAAFRPGYIPSNVDTQTYIFLDDVVRQDYQATLDAGFPASWGGTAPDYGIDPDVIGTFDEVTGAPNGDDLFGGVYAASIRNDLLAFPTLSIVMNVDDMFGPSGIYTNSTQHGIAWERATSVELIYPDGSDGFQVDAGIRIQGGAFRRHGLTKKHSLRLLFKDIYGPTKLEFPLFGDGAVERFDTITLRSDANDGWQWGSAGGQPQYARDEFGRRSSLAMGGVDSHGSRVHLYINGIYWGIYNPVERPDAAFASSYFGGEKEEWDAINSGKAVDGNTNAWNTLVALSNNVAAAATEAARTAAYQKLQGNNPDGANNPAWEDYLDVDNMIDYLLINFYGGNTDWPGHNYYDARQRGPESTGFKFFMWDSEWTLGMRSDINTDRTGVNRNVTEPYARLRASEEFRVRFGDRAHRFFFNGGAFYVDPANPQWDPDHPERNVPAALYLSIIEELESGIVGESARWGDQHRATPYTRDAEWRAETNSLLANWFPYRSANVLTQLRQASLYPGTDAPVFEINGADQHGGVVYAGDLLTMPAAAPTVYYTLDGSDPRLLGGGVSPDALEFDGTPIPLTESVTVMARALDGGEWSALNEADYYVGPATAGALAITELNYHPHDPTPGELAVDPAFEPDDFEFIELTNTTGATLDLGGVAFADGIELDFTGSAVTSLPPGERVIIVADTIAFQTRYGAVPNVAGEYSRSLANNGERITLLDRFGDTIHDFTYDDSGRWPGRADGRGSTLEVVDTAADYDNDDNWRSSAEYGGTPGTPGTGPVPTVAINEVLTRPEGSDVDAIELLNTTASDIDVGGWLLSDSNRAYDKFQIPAGTIVGGGDYRVFYRGSDFGFGLDGDGDELWLVETGAGGDPTRFADHVELGGAMAGVSFGRWPNGSGALEPMTEVTLGAANSGPLLGRIVINEIHYAGPDNTQPDEFIELHNLSLSDVDLSGWYFDDGIDYVFPDGATVAAGGFVVVAEDPATIQAAYGVAALGPWAGRLNNGGERIVLRNAAGVKEDEVDYGGAFPWSVAAGGEGSSLELVHPSLDNDLGGSWRPSGYDAALEPIQFVPAQSPAWHYRKGTSEASDPVSAWRQVGFVEDGSWQVGRASIGYGDGDDNTTLGDMRNSYSTVYLRHSFTIDSAPDIPGALTLRVYVDDGCVVWLNGVELARLHVNAGEQGSNSFAQSHEAGWEEVVIPAAPLQVGENVLAIHVLNTSLTSSDLSADAELFSLAGALAAPTPGQQSSVWALNAPPQVRQVSHGPQQPAAGQPTVITAKATDPDGVASLRLHYQVVFPGSYIPAYLPLPVADLLADPGQPRAANPAFEAPQNWTTIPMVDDGTGADEVAGDDVYTATVPGQINRTIVRYRISAEDGLGESVRLPYADDPSLNFAYYVYNGVPSYAADTRSVHPDGAGYVYSSGLLASLPVYSLITRAEDLTTSYGYDPADRIPKSNDDARSRFNWEGAFVYDGTVYDHVLYRLRQANDRYGGSGKRSMRFRFQRGHYFQAHDNYGNPYPTQWRTLNTGKMFDNKDVGNFGLTETLNSNLWNLLGVPAPWMHTFHFRVVDGVQEAPSTPDGQYYGDFWGMFLAVEDYDSKFIDAHDLPDGNLYKLKDGIFDGSKLKRNQGRFSVTTDEDFQNIRHNLRPERSDEWLSDHVNYDVWYLYHAVVEAVRHYDFRPSDTHSKNRAWFFEPYEDTAYGRLWTLPHDSDASWGPSWNAGEDYSKQAIFGGGGKPAFQQAYRNAIREFRDLVWTEEAIVQMIDDLADVVADFSMADRDRWKDAPADAGYQDFGPIEAKVQDMKNFAFVGWSGSTGPDVPPGGRAAHLDGLASADGDDTRIPDTPTVAYTGLPGFPINGLIFQATAFADPQGNGTFGAMEWRIAEITDPAAPAYDPDAPVLSEWNAAWESGELAPFRDQITVPASAVEVGHTYRVRVRMRDDTGRWSHWSAPAEFTATEPDNVQGLKDGLRITEIHYHPLDPTAAEAAAGYGDHNFFEFVELLNTSAEQTLDLNGVQITGGIAADLSATTLAPGERIVVVSNEGAFKARYGATFDKIADQYSGTLSDGGERLTLTIGGETLLDLTYDDAWHKITDGDGFSLVAVEPDGAPENLNDADGWRPSAFVGGSPGAEDPGHAPASVVINEALAHTDQPVGDWIELHNTTGQAIDISGWYLSDDADRLTAYQIASGTELPANGYLAFTQRDHFGNAGDPGANVVFGLSELGDEVLLTSADAAGALGGYRVDVDFGASGRGVTFGRHTLSTGGVDFVAMSSPTFEGSNAAPLVGPLVISEIMYHPKDGGDEFIELHNVSAAAVPLYDPAHPANTWRLSGAVGFTFPGAIDLPAGGYLLVVPTDPAIFRAAHDVPAAVPILGPYVGALDNDGESVKLFKPGEPEPDLTVPQIRVDRVKYGDALPWPEWAAGQGPSLARRVAADYGNDPANWADSSFHGTPGAPNEFHETPQAQAIDYQQDFTSGRPNGGAGWEYYASTGEGRVAVVDGELRLDDGVANATSTLVEAILHADLAGASGVVLTLDHTPSQAGHTPLPLTFTGHANGDGIAFSADGLTWHRLVDFEEGFDGRSFLLDPAVQAAGITYSADFQIKFQHYGDGPVPTDGRTLDNVRIRADLETFDLALAEGWNLVAVPVEPLDPAVAAVFPTALAEAVWEYQNPGGYAVPGEIHPKKGYWVLANAPAALQIPGFRPADATVAVSGGWNLIGAVAAAPGGSQALPSDPPALAVWQYENPGGYTVPALCGDGIGFWVLASEDATVWGMGGVPVPPPLGEGWGGGARIADCRLPIADCPSGESQIANRKSQIASPSPRPPPEGRGSEADPPQGFVRVTLVNPPAAAALVATASDGPAVEIAQAPTVTVLPREAAARWILDLRFWIFDLRFRVSSIGNWQSAIGNGGVLTPGRPGTTAAARGVDETLLASPPSHDVLTPSATPRSDPLAAAAPLEDRRRPGDPGVGATHASPTGEAVPRPYGADARLDEWLDPFAIEWLWGLPQGLEP